MKKSIIAAALILSTGILSASAFMHRDTTAIPSAPQKEESAPVATNADQVSKMTKKDIGTAD